MVVCIYRGKSSVGLYLQLSLGKAYVEYLPGLKALVQNLIKDVVKQQLLFPMCISIPFANDGYTADGEPAEKGSLKKKLEVSLQSFPHT